MSEWSIQNPIDYSPNGDDIDHLTQKVKNEESVIYTLINRLRRLDASAGMEVSDSTAYSMHVDTSNGIIYIRNEDNTAWIKIGQMKENLGINANEIGAIINGGNIGKFYLGLDEAKPTTGTSTYDVYFAYDTNKMYVWRDAAWHTFLSLNFKDMLNYADYVVSINDVATSGANKVLRLDKETGKGNIDITGSAAKILGKPIDVDALHDSDVLMYNAASQSFVNKKKDVFTEADVSYNGEPDKLVKMGTDGIANISISGNAGKVAGKKIDATGLKDGDVLSYNAYDDKFVNVKKDYISKDDITTTGESDKIVRVAADGKIHADIDGSAAKIANMKISTTGIQDGDILVYRSSSGEFVVESKSSVGSAKSLIIRNNGVLLSEYNGSETVDVDLGLIVQRMNDTTTNHVERLIGNLYLALVAANIYPDGYDGMIVETFENGAVEIDQTTTNVTSVVSGDDSIDIDDASGIIIGSHYQLTDGESMEDVQVKSLNVSGNIKRIILYENVKNQYNNGRTKLYRSSVAIYGGRAYGGGNVRTDDWDVNQTFSGSDTQVEIDSSIDYTNGSAFTLNGATLDENGHIVIGGPAIGIALVSTGGRVGTWARVDSEGDAYNG